ncbi:hypothetical protein EIN_173280 [Entamoeba invadens IP1]|uniref:C2 domain-containing protein n=1 Tax=Entamoeba invadens IP1 TaxID=370355 RepID=A0A0A1U180_ENTIV|nr:hypothetical protein EIN_173280 [Entamoeba invadens IP1]ELP84663.1 hypothetical protein EIN_173280 [Entamoeba invadens IP1]|eukprot:XP_004184009.1 hypothetical protein EIN_173280 [Entamoeba invadens IP1]
MSKEFELTLIGANQLEISDVVAHSSDPYVKFETSGTKKQKTKIINANINPYWNQRFDIKANFGEEIKFEIYDHDVIGKDDKIGTTSFVVPQMDNQEFYYDVLPVSKKGYLYICLKCTKGGVPFKRPITSADECVLFFSKISFVCEIQPRLATLELKIEGKKDQETLAFNLCTCMISEGFYVKCKPNDKITFKLNQVGLFSDSGISSAKYIVPDFREKEDETERLPLKKIGSMNFKVTCVRSVYHSAFPNQIPQKEDMGLAQVSKIYIYIEKAVGIKAKDIGGTSDAYVKMKTSTGKEKKTYIAPPSVNPVWAKNIKTKVQMGEEITFKLFDHDIIGKDDSLGDAKLHITEMNGSWKKATLDISKKGKLYIEYKWVRGISGMYHAITHGGPMPMAQPMYPQQPPMGQYPPMGYPPQQQFPQQPMGQYPPMGYPQQQPPMGQYPPQGYPPQQYPPQQPMGQYPPQGYPMQQPPMGQYPPQGYPPQQFPPQK